MTLCLPPPVSACHPSEPTVVPRVNCPWIISWMTKQSSEEWRSVLVQLNGILYFLFSNKILGRFISRLSFITFLASKVSSSSSLNVVCLSICNVKVKINLLISQSLLLNNQRIVLDQLFNLDKVSVMFCPCPHISFFRLHSFKYC